MSIDSVIWPTSDGSIVQVSRTAKGNGKERRNASLISDTGARELALHTVSWEVFLNLQISGS